MKRIALTLGALLLGGCAGPNPYVTPVEDHSGPLVTTTPTAPDSVETAPGVSVQPVEEVPVFRPLRDQVETQAEAVTGTVTPQTTSRNAAVVALLDSAQQDTSGGDLRAAQNQLERALRIAPRDPQVYYQLADVQRRLGQFLQAEQVALKGIDVASGQSEQLRRLWSLVALIRSDAGDATGARQAQEEASRY